MSHTAAFNQPDVRIELEQQQRLAKADAYLYWLFKNLEPHIGQRVLDVGCAIGNITQFFIDRQHVVGIDVAAEMVAEIEKRFAGRSNFRAYVYDITDPAVLALQRGTTWIRWSVSMCWSTCTTTRQALRHLRGLLPAGGRLILLVPIVKWVWGRSDEATGHQRRYTWRELKPLLEKHGFRVQDHWYVNFLAIFGWFFTGRILRRADHSIGPIRSCTIVSRRCWPAWKHGSARPSGYPWPASVRRWSKHDRWILAQRIVLVVPPGLPGTTPNHEGASGLGAVEPHEAGFRYAPHTVATMAAVLRDGGYEVTVLDATACGLDETAAVKAVLDARPRVVGVFVSWATREADQSFLRLLSAARPMDVLVVACGVSVRLMHPPTRTLAGTPTIYWKASRSCHFALVCDNLLGSSHALPQVVRSSEIAPAEYDAVRLDTGSRCPAFSGLGSRAQGELYPLERIRPAVAALRAARGAPM